MYLRLSSGEGLSIFRHAGVHWLDPRWRPVVLRPFTAKQTAKQAQLWVRVLHWATCDHQLTGMNSSYKEEHENMHSAWMHTCDGIQTWGREHRRWCRRCRYGRRWRCCPERPLRPCTDTGGLLLETNQISLMNVLKAEARRRFCLTISDSMTFTCFST